MKIKHNNNNNGGFTLIEVLLYIAIFSSIIMVIVALAINSIAERQKNEVFTAVNYQGEAAMEIIEQDIHEASSIASPNRGSTASAIELNMPQTSVNPTIFSTYNDGSTNHLEISQGSPSVNTYLTNSHVSISNLSFTNEGLNGTNGSIQISFSLSYKSTSTLEEFTYKNTFYGAASIPQ
jgi:type II secretory pathway pseudopilin PulG